MNRNLLFGCLAAASLAATGAATAATPEGTTPQTRLYGAPDQPNISGIWFPGNIQRPAPNGRGTGFGSLAPLWGIGDPPLKGAYLKLYEKYTAAANAGKPYADTASECKALGVPRVLFGPDPMEIIQTPGQITMIQETGHEVRRIYTDGRAQATDPDPWFDGHNVGHWEGNVLVVDVVGLRADTAMDAAETPHSDALLVTERWILKGPNDIEVDAVASDPKAFTHPWTAKYYWQRGDADYEMLEDVCEDNNRNITNPDGTQSTILGK